MISPTNVNEFEGNINMCICLAEKNKLYIPSIPQSHLLIAHFHSLTWQSHQPLPGKTPNQ